jgi:hypothetical protein
MTDDNPNDAAELPKLPVYRLEDLLIGLTPEMMRRVFDWGPDIGREIVE